MGRKESATPLQVFAENITGFLLIMTSRWTPMAHWFFIHLFKLFSLKKKKKKKVGFLPALINLRPRVSHGLPATSRSLPRPRSCSASTLAVTLLLKAFGIVEHDRLLVQASGHTQICQMQWLTLGNAGVCNPGK